MVTNGQDYAAREQELGSPSNQPVDTAQDIEADVLFFFAFNLRHSLIKTPPEFDAWDLKPELRARKRC